MMEAEYGKKSFQTSQWDPEEGEGLATTHEQVSDAYTEGTIDGVMNDVNGKDIPLQSAKKQ